MPLHFAEARANLITNEAGDSVTGTAEYKVCAVRVERAESDQSISVPAMDTRRPAPAAK